MPDNIDDAVAEFSAELGPDAWEHEAHQSTLASRLFSEVLGTFALVFIGLSIAVFSAPGDRLVVSLGFGAIVAAVVVSLSAWSGGHINPAVTVGVWLAGRFPGKDVAPYIVAQVTGAVLGGLALLATIAAADHITDARATMTSVSIGFGDNSPAGFGLGAGLAVETLATAILIAVVLAATSVKVPQAQAPFTIGGTVAMLVMFSIPFTNGSLNPARAMGTAVFAEPVALQQLWAWWLTGVLAATVVGLAFRAFGPEDDLIAEAALTTD